MHPAYLEYGKSILVHLLPKDKSQPSYAFHWNINRNFTDAHQLNDVNA
jgi:hypothetical protein